MPPCSTRIKVGGSSMTGTGRPLAGRLWASWAETQAVAVVEAIKAHRAPAVSAAAAMRAAAPAPRAGRVFDRSRQRSALAVACGDRTAADGSPPGTHFWRLSLTAPAPEATRGSSLGIVLRGGGAWGGAAIKAAREPPLWCCCSTGTAAAAGDPVGPRCSLPMSSLAGSVLGAT